jgi:hypothetical protein
MYNIFDGGCCCQLSTHIVYYIYKNRDDLAGNGEIGEIGVIGVGIGRRVCGRHVLRGCALCKQDQFSIVFKVLKKQKTTNQTSYPNSSEQS